MATKTKVALVGGPAQEKRYPEASGQTFVKGELVYLNGSGYLAEYTSAIDDGTQRFMGFAAEDGHNSTNNGDYYIGVWVGGMNEYEANVTSNGSDQATALTQIGTEYPLYEDVTNGIVMVDIALTGSQIACARVIKVDEKAAVGEVNGRVRFTVSRDACQILTD